MGNPHFLGGYIQRMTDARVERRDQLPPADQPALVVGQIAMQARPELAGELAQAAKKNPVLRADAVVLKRDGNRLYIAGSNDDSHYFAVSQLLQLWGCRWYLPSEFGECIPRHRSLKVGELNLAYGPALEVRKYPASRGSRGQLSERSSSRQIGPGRSGAADGDEQQFHDLQGDRRERLRMVSW